MSRRAKEEYSRCYTVSDPRTHEKGYTEYKVTAKFVSKKNPDDVKEVVIWKRYSDFKKLHSELSYIHRNLFRRMEEFPPFAKAQVFGRFDAAVIEERRSSAENLLSFTVNIPALYNSPQLKDFFRGREVQGPSELSASSSLQTLPPPLEPVTVTTSKKEEQQEGFQPHECSEHSSPLEDCEESHEDEPETAGDCMSAKAWEEEEELDRLFYSGALEKNLPTCSLSENEQTLACPDAKEGECISAEAQEEELDHLPNSEMSAKEKRTCSLSENELALFDPCAKEEQHAPGISHGDELSTLTMDGESLRPSNGEQHFADLNVMDSSLLSLQISEDEAVRVGEEAGLGSDAEPGGYLSQAKEQIQLALAKEAAKDYSSAFLCYRNGVDILLSGAQGDPNTTRREAVKKKTAEYLQRAEEIFNLHLRDAQP